MSELNAHPDPVRTSATGHVICRVSNSGTHLRHPVRQLRDVRGPVRLHGEPLSAVLLRVRDDACLDLLALHATADPRETQRPRDGVRRCVWVRRLRHWS